MRWLIPLIVFAVMLPLAMTVEALVSVAHLRTDVEMAHADKLIQAAELGLSCQYTPPHP